MFLLWQVTGEVFLRKSLQWILGYFPGFNESKNLQSYKYSLDYHLYVTFVHNEASLDTETESEVRSWFSSFHPSLPS